MFDFITKYIITKFAYNPDKLNLFIMRALFLIVISYNPILGICQNPLSTSDNHSIQFIGVADGLPHRTVNCITQDSLGYFWFGTKEGLCRYDGYEFLNFSTDQDSPIKLSSNEIFDILELENGVLMVGTSNGLNILDLKKGTNRILMDVEDDEQSHDRYEIISLVKDRKERIWINYGKTIWRIDDLKEMKPRSILKNPDFLKKHFNSFGLAEDRNGNIIVLEASRNIGIISKDSISMKIVPVIGDNDVEPIKFFKDLNNDLYTLSRTHTNRIAKWNSYSKTFDGVGDYVHPFYSKIPFIIQKHIKENSRINKIYLLSDDFNAGEIKTYFFAPDGLIWAGTEFGIFKIKRFNQGFDKLAAFKKESLRGLYELKNGDILVGSYSGLLKFNDENYFLEPINQTVADETVEIIATSFVEIEENLLLIGTEGQGLFHLDSNERLNRIPVPKDIFHPVIFHFLKDNQNPHLIWIGTINNLWILNSKDGFKLESFKENWKDSFFHNKLIYHFLQDFNGDIWVATDKGFFKIHYETRQVEEINILGEEKVKPYIYCIHQTVPGAFWIGTRGNGLIYWNDELKERITYTKSNGLPNNTIYSILQNESSLWLGTNNGLSRFETTIGRFTNFYESDGISHNEFNRGSYLKTREGKMFFGGLNGFTFFDPMTINQNNQAAQVRFSSLKKYNKSIDTLEQMYFLEDFNIPIAIEPTNKFFELEFFLNDYTDPSQNRYAYQLFPYDEEWIELGSRNHVQFANLSAGDYTFRVKGAGSSGQWEEEELSIPIFVHQIFYKKVWFWLLIGFVIISLVIGIYQYQIAQLKKIERIKTKLANDLHDDVGSLLTNIKLIAKLLNTHQLKEEELEKEVNRIVEMSNDAISTMSDVIWSLDNKKIRMKDLLERMQSYVDNTLVPLKIRKNFRVKALNLEQKIPIEIRQNLLLIFKESIHNIIKHTDSKQVNISFLKSGEYFKMRICNQINSTNPQASGNRQGLKSMEYRAKRIGGSIIFEKDEDWFNVEFQMLLS